MSIYEFASYLATLVGLIITLTLVAIRSVRVKANRYFILWGSVIGLYVAGSFVGGFISSNSGELLWTRVSIMFANFIPLPFYFFSLSFANYQIKHKWLNLIVCLIPVGLIPIAFLRDTVSSVASTNLGPTLVGTGPLLLLTLLYFLVVFSFSFRVLYQHAKVSSQSRRSQIKLISYSSGAVIVINLLTQIILPEIHIVNLGNIIGNPSIVLFVGAVGYSILLQKLFDIRSAILRTFAFAAFLFVVVVVFAIAILVPAKLLFPHLSLSQTEELYFIVAGVTLAFMFRSLTPLLQKWTDSLFYQDHYDTEMTITQVGRILASEIVLDNLSQNVRNVLAHNMHIKQVDIVVLDKDRIFYEAGKYFAITDANLTNDLQQLGNHLLVTDELVEGPQKSILQKYGISVFEVLKTRDDKVGYLLFSEKLNGTSYNDTDVDVINIVSDALAIAIQNSRAYSHIQQFNILLQRKIEEATRQLRNVNEQLKQQDIVKNDFISMVSHQLGTPLTVVDGFLSLIVQGFYGSVSTKAQNVLEKSLSTTRMMKGMVSDLLNISRMTAGKFFLELSVIDMNKLVSEQVEDLANQAMDKHVKLTYHPPPKPVPSLIIDGPKTQQAVMNLINNAIFYAANGVVDVYLEADGKNVIFRVVDNGIGVPDDQKAKLFTKFFRADNAKKESPNGTGIGLYLVKRVVDDQNGKIIFFSQVGKGSTFGFSLPVKSPSLFSSQPVVYTADTAHKP